MNENYLIARLDQKLGAKDDFFVRVVRDAGTFGVPFPSGVVSGDSELDTTANYYTTLQERRTFTTNLINVLRAASSARRITGIRRVRWGAYSMNSRIGMRMRISPLPASPPSERLGQVPMTEVQNKFPIDEQVYWTHGAHDVRIGGTINRSKPANGHP